MKKIFAIAWKDTRLRFAGPAEWLFFLILPIIFTVVLAGGTGGSADDRVRLVVVDEAASPLSAQFLDALGRSATVRPDLLPRAEADSQFSQRRAPAELVIPPEFDMPHLLQGPLQVALRQQPNNPNALVAYQAVMNESDRIGSLASIAEASVAAAEQAQPFASAADHQAYFAAALAAARAQQAQVPERLTISRGTTADRIAYDPRANSSAGQLITWVFIPLLGISGMFAYERQRGTLRRLLTSPTRSATYLQGTILGQVATALVQMLLLVGFGIAVMHLNWGQDPAALALILLATALAGAALGTMLGAFVRSEGQAGGLSWMLGMLMALLGGCWYPAELFPPFVRTFSLVLPTTWAMQGMLNIVSRGLGLAGVLLPATVLLGMAALFFIIGAKRFRFE
jgi:ABC-2 type transport system permease protein